MSPTLSERDAQKVLDELVDKADPHDLDKLDRPFHDKLARLKDQGGVSAEMLDQLHVLWEMLKAPDDVVPFQSKALIMGAVTYFVSPVDLIPDNLGFAGYLDDMMVVRLVYNRLGEVLDTFRAHRT
jgi:uncharacterized membrane protein YkvA (DUF1232 family)